MPVGEGSFHLEVNLISLIFPLDPDPPPPFFFFNKDLILSSCLMLKFSFIVLDNYKGRDLAKQALSSDGGGLGL